MTEKNDTGTEQNAASMDWNKMMQEYWLPRVNPWSNLFQPPKNEENDQFDKGRVAELLHTTTRMWQTMLGAMSQPSAFEDFQKATATTPDITLGFAQTCLQGITSLQTQAGDWIQKRGASLSTADVQQLDKELIKDLTETYEKEFSKYLKVPQIGLGRIYQERLMNVADKHNTFQLTLSKFLHLLYLPIEKSLKSLQDNMAEMAESGSLDDKTKTYYNLWIKLLEGEYMNLFKQSEYTDEMGNTLFALNEFVGAKQTVINDVLKQINIPSYPDLDELSKEIYLLKKRVRSLERQ